MNRRHFLQLSAAALAAAGGIVSLQAQQARRLGLPPGRRLALQQIARQGLPSKATAGPRVHDPSTIVKCNDEYWVFYTGRGIPSWRSKDLVKWTAGPQTITASPPWVAQAVPGNRSGLDFWAPEVAKVGDRYLLYYAVSTFGQKVSAIGVASNPTLDPADAKYHWTDLGIAVQTGAADNFNAIDPALLQDAKGNWWLSFGSFWSGIKLIQIDPATGKRSAPTAPILSLAYARQIEASYLYHHGDFYYLIVNWGQCCRGISSTYNMRIGRSREITGPYLDKAGIDLAKGGGTLLLETDGDFIGPGQAGILQDGDKTWISMHFYDGTTPRGTSELAIRPLTWTANGWPVIGEVT